jgi:hypothetical protein
MPTSDPVGQANYSAPQFQFSSSFVEIYLAHLLNYQLAKNSYKE